MTHPIPPYGVAVRQALASGELDRMRATAAEAEEYLRNAESVQTSLAQLRAEIARLEAAATR